MLRLIENLRFTKAPTCAIAFDMVGNWLGFIRVLVEARVKREESRDFFFFWFDSGK